MSAVKSKNDGVLLKLTIYHQNRWLSSTTQGFHWSLTNMLLLQQSMLQESVQCEDVHVCLKDGIDWAAEYRSICGIHP